MSTKDYFTIGISLLSLTLSILALGWNIYRELILKARPKVTFAVGTVFANGVESTKLFLQVVNHGPGKLNCRGLTLRDVSLWRRLLRRVRHWIILPEFGGVAGSTLPKMLDVGEEGHFTIPFEKDCFLRSVSNQIGVTDSFGRVHWASRHDMRRARKEFIRQYQDGLEPRG